MAAGRRRPRRRGEMVAVGVCAVGPDVCGGGCGGGVGGPRRERRETATSSVELVGLDGTVAGTGRSETGRGGVLRSSQTGNVQRYFTVLLVGVLALILGAVAL